LTVTEIIEVSASAAFCLAGIRFRSGRLGRLGQMPWYQYSTWSLRTASIRWLPPCPASGDHVEERRAVCKPVNIGYDGFGDAA
jgi:hypothetical protein